MVVDYLGVARLAVFPHKAHAPLLVDTDAVSFAIALERFELIARWHGQGTESRRRVEVLEFLARTLLNLAVDSFHELAAKNRFGALVLERTNLVTWLVPTV